MSTRVFSEPQLLRYITALHEAAHAFVAHKAEHWKINDPAVTFPGPGTGHLARAHFGPRVMQPSLTKEHVREYVKIGFAGLHGQNLIDQRSLLSVLSSRLAGCEDDLLAIEEKAKAAGIEDEIESLMRQSLDLVTENAQTIRELADVIYNSTSDVPQADLLKVLGAVSKPEPGLSRPIAFSSDLCGWFKSIFRRKQ